MKTVLMIFGTRPEAIKMCPLVKELKKRKSLRALVAVTGQHREMLDEVLRCFSVTPDYDLDLFAKERTLTDLNATLLSGVGRLLRETGPDLVLVHGDTATAFMSALAAFFAGIPVGHVEAGLRSGSIKQPFPEELNRRGISLLSALDFAPTPAAGENLLRMGKSESRIFVTGNTVIDALKTTVREEFSHPLTENMEGKRLILLTCHRRENLGEPIRRIFRAALAVADAFSDARIICPLHKNPRVREAAAEVFGGRKHPHVFLTEPLGAVECHNIMARSTLILTDSGGLQEEAPALGVPVLVLRETTERPEAVEAGAAILCGSDEGRILSEATRLLSDREYYAHFAQPRPLYGDGNAAVRIAEQVEQYLADETNLLDKRSPL